MAGRGTTLHTVTTRRVLYSVVCGAAPAAYVDRLVIAARERGWAVQVIATATPVFTRSVTELRTCGVTVLFGPDVADPHPPRTAETRIDAYPWQLALDALEPPSGQPAGPAAA